MGITSLRLKAPAVSAELTLWRPDSCAQVKAGVATGAAACRAFASTDGCEAVAEGLACEARWSLGMQGTNEEGQHASQSLATSRVQPLCLIGAPGDLCVNIVVK